MDFLLFLFFIFYFLKFVVPNEHNVFVATQLGFYFSNVHWQQTWTLLGMDPIMFQDILHSALWTVFCVVLIITLHNILVVLIYFLDFTNYCFNFYIKN